MEIEAYSENESLKSQIKKRNKGTEVRPPSYPTTDPWRFYVVLDFLPFGVLPFFFLVLYIYWFTELLYRLLEIHFNFTFTDKGPFLRNLAITCRWIMGFMIHIQILETIFSDIPGDITKV